ncbi:MAG: nucleotidyltransferase domain-containing protein, partial [Promethearchaeia archaeon]
QTRYVPATGVPPSGSSTAADRSCPNSTQNSVGKSAPSAGPGRRVTTPARPHSIIIFVDMKKTKSQIRRLIREYVNSVDSKAEVILYGSRARGDERADSDWDILILTDYPVDLATEEKFRDKLYDLELEIDEPLSVFIYSKNEWKRRQRITPFYRNVNKEGIAL